MSATKPKRLLQVTCAILWCLLAAGPVFGFAALKPVLIAQGVYSDRCDISTSDSQVPCTEQDLALNLMFTVACMVTNISALPVGYILDIYGPKITGIIGSIILSLGAIAMIFAPSVDFADLYLACYTLLALGGPFVFISCFQLANSFPKNSGTILALLTGSFDTSSALFLGYRVIYTNYFELPVSSFFTYYLVVPLFIFICQLTIMPTTSYKTVGTLAKIAETAIDESGRPLDKTKLLQQDRNIVPEPVEQASMSETTSLLMRRASFGVHETDRRRGSNVSRASRSSNKSVYEQDAEDKLYESTGGVFGILHGYSIIDQIRSPWFYLMVVFTTIQMLRINYFVATVRAQELYLYDGDQELAAQINHFFDIALPLGGICSIPFIGMILDNMTTLSVLWILSIVSVSVGILGLVSWLPGTYAGIVLLVLYRPFYYTAVSDFCAKVFGFETFGTVYGTIVCISGICNIFQQLLDRITHVMFNTNPGPVNSVLTALTVVFALALIFFVRSQEMEMKRRNLELEAENSSSQWIPH
ncbi:hypothetical protein FT663_01327 [Candidozyma haemuli var. vulneris]|uniref:Protein FMP42 n=1 Tax=Candidozyma haemuli TaxID=45357 RepID=A0A2V1AY60_9ASCO|nr:hypothetical protein CXQ85_002481 [[Candida] haemuloni]KAF3993916.1 hypothetical protein FT662_00364 [[Candida] haemuloni var. vulneris]KAF3994527.1 hypothetical protein FT663_01327 [[Candida] haemuloni var. vulneris]PVH22762.1 hypothetical protein CXQ85_002481 [[Candida] haemuloni]